MGHRLGTGARCYPRRMAGAGFEWIGPEGETRLLLHRTCGYSIAIPGHPAITVEEEAGPPTRDVIVKLSKPSLELGFRLDTLPTAIEPEALATSLALAYGTTRAGSTPAIELHGGLARAIGADAIAAGIYPYGPDALGSMERLMVAVRRNGDQAWALYWTIRFAKSDVNAIRWAHVQTAMTRKQHWDPAAPRTAAPSLWPPDSRFAEPSAALEWTDEAWAEAQAKAGELGPLTDHETQGLLDAVIGFARSEDPPTREVDPYVTQLMTRKLILCGPPAAAEILARNLDQVRTTHDLRAWCWQCVWAIGNRASLTPGERQGSFQ